MSSRKSTRTSHAVLGVLSFDASTGYEIRKLLQETTSHFWKESYGQIYPTLEQLHKEGLIELTEHETTGRETRRFRILPAGEETLHAWIRSPEVLLKPGRNELLLKLFFARKDDAPYLIPQVESYRQRIAAMARAYEQYQSETTSEDIPADARTLIGTTIDYGVAAAEMQNEWCDRTLATLQSMA